MKLCELLKEEREVNLIGRTINGKLVTQETRNEIWVGDFWCDHNKLTSLTGSPKEVDGRVSFAHNNLMSLKDSPKKVSKDFICMNNKLTSLIGAPKEVGGHFVCVANNLTSLEGASKNVGGTFDCSNNKLTNLKDIHKIIKKMNNGYFSCSNNLITSHVLGVLLIPGIIAIISDGEWGGIINKYLDKGRAGLIDCQNELIDSGLEEFAQL